MLIFLAPKFRRFRGERFSQSKSFCPNSDFSDICWRQMSMLFQWQMADPWTNHQRYSIMSINTVKGLEILYPKSPPPTSKKSPRLRTLWIFVCVFDFFLIWLHGILCFGDYLNYIIITVTVIVDSLSLLGRKKKAFVRGSTLPFSPTIFSSSSYVNTEHRL